MSEEHWQFELFLQKARDAAHNGHDAWVVQSTGEKLGVALVLNRADWLAEMGYTMAGAIERIGLPWVKMIPGIVARLESERP
jgi:hypothetical protein